MKPILIFRLSDNMYEIRIDDKPTTFSTESWDDESREALEALYKLQVRRTKALLDAVFTK